MSRIGVVTQARMTSTRLPGKIMLEAAGKSMMRYHLERLRAADLEVYVATTTNAVDDRVVEEALAIGAEVYRGSEHDVLGRFAGAASGFGLDIVVRVTSDCPLIDGDLIQRGIELFQQAGNDDLYVSNVSRRTFPRGFDFEVFSATALLQANANATLPSEREHVTPYIYRNRSGRTLIRSIVRPEDASKFRITLDTIDDLELIRCLIEDHGAARLDAEGIIALMEGNTKLSEINGHVEQKEFPQ